MTRTLPFLLAVASAWLPGCVQTGCIEDPEVGVTPWEGTPGMGVTWEELGDVSVPRIEDLLDRAALAGEANGTVPLGEFQRFEGALDRAWEDTGRPGSRERSIVRYQGTEWDVEGQGACVQ